MNARPSALILSLFERLFAVKPREFGRVQAFFAFLTTTSIYFTIGAAVGDTLFLSRFGAQRGEELLPWVYVGIGLLTIALTWAIERLEHHYPRDKFIIAVHLALAFSVLAFRFALRSEQLWLYYALVIWLEASGLVAIVLFFSFSGDYFTSRDARRLYGYINGGVALGSLAGGTLVGPLVRVMGNENILYVCAGFLACGAGWTILVSALAQPVEDDEEDEGGHVPLAAVLKDPFLQIIMVVVIGSQLYCHLVDYQLKVVASRELQEEALAVFFGNFYGALGVAQFVVQFALVGWLWRRFGVVKSLFLLPILLLAVGGTFFAMPVLRVATIANFIHFTFLETLDEPATELLFMPLPSRLRLRAQAFVEGMVLPGGIFLSGVLLLVLHHFLHDLRHVSLVGLAIGVVWIAAVIVMGPRYRNTLATSLRQLGLEGFDLSSAWASAEGRKAILELLQSENADQQVIALGLCRGRVLGPLAEAVERLTASTNAEVAAKAIEALAGDKRAPHPAIRRGLADSRAGVRAAAVSAVLETDAEGALATVTRHFDDPETAVRVATLTGYLARGGRLGASLALARLAELVRSRDVSKRVEAAQIIEKASHDPSSALFLELLDDPSVEVRREVIAAAGAAPDPELAPWLPAQLREPALRPAVAAALEGMPLSAVPAFIDLIGDRARPLEDRSVLARILGKFGGLRGAKVLWELVDSREDVMLRLAAAETLLYMKGRNEAHDLSRYHDDGSLLERLEELETIHRACEQVGDRDPFFSQVLFDHARLECKTALFALALPYDDRQIHRVEASLFSESQSQRSNALEIIEVIFPHDKAARILGAVTPLVEEEGSADAPGLSPEIAEKLLRGQPWLRVATRRHLEQQGADAKGLAPEVGSMSGQEAHLYKLLSRVSFLTQVRVFDGMSSNYLSSLAKIMHERTFVDGEVLFSEGAKADSFYLVQEGAIKLAIAGKEVARLGPKDSVGEMALLEDLPYSASATAVGELRALKASAQDFMNVLLTHPEITLALLRHVSANLRETQGRLAAAAEAPHA